MVLRVWWGMLLERYHPLMFGLRYVQTLDCEATPPLKLRGDSTAIDAFRDLRGATALQLDHCGTIGGQSAASVTTRIGVPAR